ncbi:B12-binding domain-containing radical SAM protein [Patescibacteria group bacterium]|nr:B12-binding domain-containing radical SAM protein [Patescibacteria group bacterium]
MKIQLYFPDQEIGKSWMDKAFWPAGLMSIATYLRQEYPQVKIEILDGRFDKNLKEKINADIVGVSVGTFSYQNGLQAAKIAKQKGAKVILGGPHATFLAKEILKNRKFIDAVIKYKGEKAFTEYILGHPKKDIKNLVWRNGKRIVENSIESPFTHLDELPPLDYNLIDLQRYFDVQKKLAWTDSNKSIYILTHEGCIWREKTGGCIFCAITDPKKVYRNPKKVWYEIETAVNKFGINYIKDFGDTISDNKEWLKKFVGAKPKTINPKFNCYVAARDIDEELIKLLTKINTVHVYIGFESGNNKMLKNIGKGMTASQNIKAIKLLTKGNIKILASYVLGAPEETEGTLKDTYEMAQKIASIGKVELSSASILVPLPGSRAYGMLLEKYPKYVGKDDLDVYQIKKDWVKTFCKVDYKTIKKYTEKISALAPLKNDLAL